MKRFSVKPYHLRELDGIKELFRVALEKHWLALGHKDRMRFCKCVVHVRRKNLPAPGGLVVALLRETTPNPPRFSNQDVRDADDLAIKLGWKRPLGWMTSAPKIKSVSPITSGRKRFFETGKDERDDETDEAIRNFMRSKDV